MNTLICDKCWKEVVGIEGLKKHYRHDHFITLAGENKNGFRCLNGGCKRHFLKFGSLVRHIKSTHVINDDDMQEQAANNYLQQLKETNNDEIGDHVE